VDVRIVRQGDSVTIEVLDDGRGFREPGNDEPALGTGQGIAGMRERAGIYAGTVDAGPGIHGGWRVRAELKWNGDKGKS
jgi:signal transduction histidine kinase